jgi:putative SOS response-associated peptidase YedK
MCGRVLIGENKDVVITGRDGRKYQPKPNGTGNPGSMLPVVTDAMPGKVQYYRWGLLTPDDDKIHSKHKHARIENLTTIPLWRELVGHKHCIIKVQAFFEYNREHEKMYKIERVDGEHFYIAGLWDIWIDIKTNVLLPTCAMITMPPNSAMAQIHDRMPAMLDRAQVKNWLNSDISHQQRIQHLHDHACQSEQLKITVQRDDSTK